MKKVLMIAFHFPPVAMGSGHLRTLGFARYLPDMGWEPTVLSANAAAFPQVDAGNISLIPDNCRVHRAFALDAGRHLSVCGKYPGFLVQPDRWATWWPGAVWQGLQVIRRHRISAIWSTYPIMTAHCIAHTLSRMTGLPWVADFRDPVASSVDTGNRFSVSSQKRCERRVLAHAARSVFTTPRAMQWCAERYPEACRAGRLTVIANGYDDEAFAELGCPPPRTGRPLVLLHSGLLYPEGRNPAPFFAALARLRDSGSVTPGMLKVILRASGSEAAYTREVQRFGLGEIVTLAPPIGNHEALLEQATADGLLLFQGSKFDLQIPAKVYEYLRIGLPIFALVGPNGDTAALLRESGGAELVAADDVDAIAMGLRGFLHALTEGTTPSPRPAVVAQYSRRAGAIQLASLLDQVCT